MNENRHVFLVGFMGAGKSSVGRLVAARLGRPFVDTDVVITASAGMSVSEIFSREGEESFRNRETAALAGLENLPPAVVACGGGIVLRDENRAALKRMGTVVCLLVDEGTALARVGAADSRPLLAGPGGATAAQSLLAAREALYASVADLTVDTVGQTVREVADAVIDAMRGVA